jgi:TRAP-type mannitol/chloroaromatic compound transport system permease small subunit
MCTLLMGFFVNMVPVVYLTTRRYEFQATSIQFLRLEFYLLNTDGIFIIAAVFATDGVSLLPMNYKLHQLTKIVLQIIFTQNNQKMKLIVNRNIM